MIFLHITQYDMNEIGVLNKNFPNVDSTFIQMKTDAENNDWKLTLDEISSSYMEPRVIRKHKIDHDRTRN